MIHRILPASLGALLIIGLATAVAADGKRVTPVSDPEVKKICGECHLAFPPAFLPARSWASLLDHQADHFGEDLALLPEEVQRVKAYLTSRAGDAPNGGGMAKFMRWVAPGGIPTRITENPAFLREHYFPDRVWSDPKVLTKSNCQACHTGAEQGWFED